MEDIKDYSIEQLAADICDFINNYENGFYTLRELVEFEYTECNAIFNLTFSTSLNRLDCLELDNIDIEDMCLCFDDSETEFTSEEMDEVEKAVKLQF
jgi:hypothetical protein